MKRRDFIKSLTLLCAATSSILSSKRKAPAQISDATKADSPVSEDLLQGLRDNGITTAGERLHAGDLVYFNDSRAYRLKTTDMANVAIAGVVDTDTPKGEYVTIIRSGTVTVTADKCI